MNRFLLGLAAAACSGSIALAQIPGVPAAGAAGAATGATGAAGAAGAAGAVPAAAAPAAAAPSGLAGVMSLLGIGSGKCKKKLCNSGIGKMAGAMLSPLSLATGGMMGGGCCPKINPDDLAMPADSAQGAASRIQQEEANAAARRAAVKYLGTVNCKYFPEAEGALINALRGDTNECVRMEAAKSLLNGCCCSKKTMAALTITVNGSDKDGHPGEISECVRAIAYLALQKCVCKFVDTSDPKPTEASTDPKEKDKKEPEAKQAAYYEAIERNPQPNLLAEARHTVARGLNISRETYYMLSGPNTLAGTVSVAWSEPPKSMVNLPADAPLPTASMPVTATAPMPTSTVGPIRPAAAIGTPRRITSFAEAWNSSR